METATRMALGGETAQRPSHPECPAWVMWPSPVARHFLCQVAVTSCLSVWRQPVACNIFLLVLPDAGNRLPPHGRGNRLNTGCDRQPVTASLNTTPQPPIVALWMTKHLLRFCWDVGHHTSYPPQKRYSVQRLLITSRNCSQGILATMTTRMTATTLMKQMETRDSFFLHVIHQRHKLCSQSIGNPHRSRLMNTAVSTRAAG